MVFKFKKTALNPADQSFHNKVIKDVSPYVYVFKHDKDAGYGMYKVFKLEDDGKLTYRTGMSHSYTELRIKENTWKIIGIYDDV